MVAIAPLTHPASGREPGLAASRSPNRCAGAVTQAAGRMATPTDARTTGASVPAVAGQPAAVRRPDAEEPVRHGSSGTRGWHPGRPAQPRRRPARPALAPLPPTRSHCRTCVTAGGFACNSEFTKRNRGIQQRRGFRAFEASFFRAFRPFWDPAAAGTAPWKRPNRPGTGEASCRQEGPSGRPAEREIRGAGRRSG